MHADSPTGVAVLVSGLDAAIERRPTDARELLHTAYDMFTAMGAEGMRMRAGFT